MRWLTTRVFSDADYLGGGLYRIPAELACTQTATDPQGATTTTTDPSCVARVAAMSPRIRVEDGDGLQFWLQLGADHDEPVGITLRPDELAITVNLDDASRAAAAVAAALGAQAPSATTAGQATADLEVLAPARVQASLVFDRPISIAIADRGAALDSDTALRIGSVPGTVATVVLDGGAHTLLGHLGLGETAVHAPATDTAPGRDLVLGGATLDASYSAGTLQLTHISLGTRTTTLAVGGERAIAIDLDPEDGRELGAIASTEADGSETIAVSPRLDLAIATDHAVLGDVPPRYDVTRIRLDGALRANAVTGALEVIAGTLAVTTDPTDYGFSAAAGDCVTTSVVADTATASTYVAYRVAGCP